MCGRLSVADHVETRIAELEQQLRQLRCVVNYHETDLHTETVTTKHLRVVAEDGGIVYEVGVKP